MYTTFTKVADSGNHAGTATNVRMLNWGGGCLTAVRNASGNLELIGWRTFWHPVEVTRLFDSGGQAGAVTEFAMSSYDAWRPITAVRAGRGQLKVIEWLLPEIPPKNIQRVTDGGDGPDARHIDTKDWMTNDSAGMLTAHEAGNGLLQLTMWGWQGNRMVKRGDSGNQGGQADLIAFKPYADPASGHITTRYTYTTAVRTSAGRLQLISWALLSENGDAIQRLSDTGGQGESIDMLAMALNITAVRTTDGRLKLIHWEVDNGVITRRGDSGTQGELVTGLSIDNYSTVRSLARYVTAVITPQGLLKLIAWDIAADGSLTRTGDSGAISIGAREVAVNAFQDATDGSARVITAIIDGTGRLKVITWDMADHDDLVLGHPIGGPTTER